MKHFGDITKISGYDAPVVDAITGGSPCQDLSVAGKRAGLAGERSGLFMEQIRIIKEMRSRNVPAAAGSDRLARYPRYCIWENVPGAFSSNKGKDFQAVLSEFVRIAEPGAPDVPMPEGGRWPKAGCLYDELGNWSIAWRLHDAQFWGVPQRRKRIALVADFGGLSAPEVLFERKGLSRDPEPGTEAGQATAGAFGGSTVVSIQGNTIDRDAHENGSGISEGISHTLNSVDRHGVYCIPDVANTLTRRYDGSPNPDKKQGANIAFKAGQGSKAGGIGAQEECSPTLSAAGSGSSQVPAVYDARGNGNGKIVPTITGDHGSRVTDYTALAVGNGQLNQMSMAEQANTLDTMHDQQAVIVFDKEMYNCGRAMRGEMQARFDNVSPTCRADSHPSGVLQNVVRRLTPMECERLQGFPDGWTDIGEWTDSKGKKHKDAESPRYKALGNSIALPFWQYLARRICAQYERPVTMASLFDGIGGFPLVFQRCGAIPVWASEIEEFPMAVTKKRFPEEGF